ncbi:MAG: alpha/beta fold hydrolase [Chitinispirillaceae bacterium]|nr:alpha/beta fold hydrolase [Chitinispirillaceae bacterium]
MVERWIVFGGWALRPEILDPLFGRKVLFIDTNGIMPELVRNGSLVPQWQDVLVERILPHLPGRPFGITGWSTGSLLAYALAQKTAPSCGVFISSTPSFCRRKGFPYGWKPASLKAMRGELQAEPATVLAQVYAQCGYNSGDFGPEISPAVLDNLSTGLSFLEQATLLPVKKLSFPSLFLHGKDDAIIPASAGKYLCEAAGGTFSGYKGPHAFFLKRSKAVADSITRFSEKVIS